MPRFFITLAYNGKNYVGWQTQPNGVSVQQTIETALSTILRQQIAITGAGRTDAGVHAHKMVAHFDCDNLWDDRPNLVRRLNGFLPKDIAISRIEPVADDAHARFSAIARTYKYYMTVSKDPFLHDYKLRILFDPDLETMNRLCEVIKEYSDFTSFSKLHTDVKTNICSIHHAHWERDGDNITFTITANRFLRNMVRAIVGTMLEAGKGRLDEPAFRQIIESRNRCLAGHSAPAHALFLHDVVYPF